MKKSTSIETLAQMFIQLIELNGVEEIQFYREKIQELKQLHRREIQNAYMAGKREDDILTSRSLADNYYIDTFDESHKIT
jgi:hypothetical protein